MHANCTGTDQPNSKTHTIVKQASSLIQHCLIPLQAFILSLHVWKSRMVRPISGLPLCSSVLSFIQTIVCTCRCIVDLVIVIVSQLKSVARTVSRSCFPFYALQGIMTYEPPRLLQGLSLLLPIQAVDF